MMLVDGGDNADKINDGGDADIVCKHDDAIYANDGTREENHGVNINTIEIIHCFLEHSTYPHCSHREPLDRLAYISTQLGQRKTNNNRNKTMLLMMNKKKTPMINMSKLMHC